MNQLRDSLLFEGAVTAMGCRVWQEPPATRRAALRVISIALRLVSENRTEAEYRAWRLAAYRRQQKSKINDNREMLHQKKMKREGFVYLCRNNRNGLTKIGFSKVPDFRESTLQSEEPDVAMLCQMRGTMADEKNLHKLYAKHRVRGEWFRLSQEDINLIAVVATVVKAIA